MKIILLMCLLFLLNGLISLYLLPIIRYKIYWHRYTYYQHSNDMYFDKKYEFGNFCLAILFPYQFFDGDKLSSFSYSFGGGEISNYNNYADMKKSFNSENVVIWYLFSVSYFLSCLLWASFAFVFIKTAKVVAKLLYAS